MVLPRALVAAAIVVLALAGCSARPGVAAVVDGETISEAALAETVHDFRLFSDAPPGSVLQALVVSPFWNEAAADVGLGTSTQEGLARLESLAAETGVDVERAQFGPGLVSIARVIVAQQKAVEAGVAAELAAEADRLVRAAEIEVSPRYGEWSAEGLVATSPPWLLPEPGETQ